MVWTEWAGERVKNRPINWLSPSHSDNVNVNVLLGPNLIATIENGLCWARAHATINATRKQQQKRFGMRMAKESIK